MNPSDQSETPGPARPHQYVVVARRYRPQTFDELVGQEHIARALSNAISTNRVGHAYLFTGARGVGKTSAARILAKALNCAQGPAPVPCNRCDICQAISAGEDVDVLEIDGASNRGIDEIRQLRQNVNIRPSRERFKVYIIDEVHMLTREAFNALLKTLEEPPEHVKFIFCTTDPAKIPPTILSRCQRFDFAGIQAPAIAERLRQIVAAEGVQAEPEALELLARRAGGSMRDSQSLLEQLLSFAPERITVADVTGMLGIAGEERLAALLGHMVRRDAAAALAELDAAVREGVDLGQLVEQLLGYLRDCMVAAAGCPKELFASASPTWWPKIVESSQKLGLETVLAAVQILDQTLARLRFTTQGRVLVELAITRLCHLEDVTELPALIAQLQGGAAPQPGGAGQRPPVPPAAEGPAAKKNFEPAASRPFEPPSSSPIEGIGGRQTEQERIPLTGESAGVVWSIIAAKAPGLAGDHARHFAHVAISAPNRLVVSFRPRYTFSKSACERPEQKARFEQALADLTGERVQLDFTLLEEEETRSEEPPLLRPVSQQQRIMQVSQHAMLRRAAELFGAQPLRVEDPPRGG